jgi:hypothetical protein
MCFIWQNFSLSESDGVGRHVGYSPRLSLQACMEVTGKTKGGWSFLPLIEMDPPQLTIAILCKGGPRM